MFFTGIDQVGLVVRDLDATMRHLHAVAGVGPWWVKTFAPPHHHDTRLRGKPVHYTMRVALARTGATQWELIQPLEGPSIYTEFLDAHGEGLHHVQMALGPEGYDACVARMTALGCPPLMEGRFHTARYCYFDSEGPLTTVLEIRDAPADFVRPEPDAWFPGPPSA